MDGIFNVITQDIEASCVCCPNTTRCYVIEYNSYICIECIKILSAVEVIAERRNKEVARHVCN